MLEKRQNKYRFISHSDRDPPAADLHDLEVPGNRVRARGHRRPRDGGRPRPHEVQGEEEGRTEERAAATDIQRGKLLRGRRNDQLTL